MKDVTKRMVQIIVVVTFALLVCIVLYNNGHGKTKQLVVNDQGMEVTDTYSMDVFAMDTYMTITAYGDQAKEAVEASVAEINRLDALLSTGSDDSEVTLLNQNGGGKLSADTLTLLNRSMEIGDMTKGAFDITILPVMRAWGFGGDSFQVPEKEVLDSMLLTVDYSKLVLSKDTNELIIPEGASIDFGGIAKGYLGARIHEIMESYGVEHAIANLGGNVQLVGNKENGAFWKVGIQSPDLDGTYLGVLSVADVAVVTSGGYERYFEEDGIIYHHIIDPTTGYPAQNGILSVSIISKDGTLADGLSTACYILGKEKAISLWRSNSDSYDFILYTDAGELLVSEGLDGTFDSDLPFEIIAKQDTDGTE